MRILLFAVVGMLLPAFLPRAALPHAEPYSWVDLNLESNALQGQVTAHVVDLAHEIELDTPDSLADGDFVAGHLDALHAALDRLLKLEADGTPIRPQWTSFKMVLERSGIGFQFRASVPHRPREIRLVGPLFAYDPAHETYFNVYEGRDLRHQDLLDSGHTESRYTTGVAQGRGTVVRTFLEEGVHHIFIGPDHILFVIGLLLLGGSVRQLLKIVTAFTIAHSITLALAATGLVTPPARLVEPAIALSIVYVGAGNLFSKRHRDARAIVAACFGLVHGFGFASVLRELGLPRGALAWSLFSFNVGVEIGQACIVLAVAPLLAFLRRRRPAAARAAVLAGSTCVMVAGTYWFIQRAFLS